MTILDLNMTVSLIVLFSCFIIIAFRTIKEKTRKTQLNQNMNSMIQKMDIVSMIQKMDIVSMIKDSNYDIRKKV